jgi:hypothetical protein
MSTSGGGRAANAAEVRALLNSLWTVLPLLANLGVFAWCDGRSLLGCCPGWLTCDSSLRCVCLCSAPLC